MLKLSIVLSTQPASFSALAYKGELEINLGKIHDLGYDGVELAVRDPGLLNLPELELMLKRYDLTVPAIGTGQAFGEEGLSLSHSDSRIRQMAIERMRAHLTLAKRLNAVVIVGLLRGTCASPVERAAAEQRFLESLTECVHGHSRVLVVIEPINRYETQLINTVETGLRFLDKLKLDQVGLLLDTFHMNIEEPSILQSMESAGERIFHFHLADSNRWYPGAGHVDFAAVVETLAKIGYQKFLSAEILPLPDPDTAAVKTITRMRSLLA